MRLSSLIKLMRPHQYVKNLFILLPLFFGMKLTDPVLLIKTLLGVVAFSLAASAVYIFNDYNDIDEDRKHPTKRFRPLASGSVSPKTALLLAAALIGTGAILMGTLALKALVVMLLYIVLNVFYSLYLKHVAIIDVTIIAVGFVLRLFIGAYIADITLSQWIVVMTFLLALFMALAKRRDDVLLYLDTGEKTRKVIDGYNLPFLDSAIVIMASVVIVAYTIYTISDSAFEHLHSRDLYLTSVFVILGILRYLQLTFVYQDSGSPTKIILHDRFTQAIIAGWFISFIGIIYL